MNCKIPKKYIHCIRRAFVKKLEAGKQKTTESHSVELIGSIKRNRFFKMTTQY